MARSGKLYSSKYWMAEKLELGHSVMYAGVTEAVAIELKNWIEENCSIKLTIKPIDSGFHFLTSKTK